MKKLGLLATLLATIPFLASCNQKVSTLPIKCHQYDLIQGELYLVGEETFEYNNKGLLIKDTLQYVQADISDIHEYEYDEKGNVIKDTLTRMESGTVGDTDVIEYIYIYDERGRITKKTEKKNSVIEQISEYTYESDLVDWKTYKCIDGDSLVVKNITRTFNSDLYEKAVDSIKNKYYYYTWNEHKCNTKIETYSGEEKIPTNHEQDETYEYHKNMPNKLKKYVLTSYDAGVIEFSNTTQTDYDKYDRMTKVSNYDGETLDSYFIYEY